MKIRSWSFSTKSSWKLLGRSASGRIITSSWHGTKFEYWVVSTDTIYDSWIFDGHMYLLTASNLIDTYLNCWFRLNNAASAMLRWLARVNSLPTNFNRVSTCNSLFKHEEEEEEKGKKKKKKKRNIVVDYYLNFIPLDFNETLFNLEYFQKNITPTQMYF